MKRKYFGLALLLLMIVLVATGCSTNTTEPDPRNGFWDAFFVYPLYLLLDFSANFLWGQYGLAILVVTLLVRVAILPLTIKQYKSTRAMQVLQPELAKIKEKYKDNPQKQQQETMLLFQKHGVNPLAGCLPLLIQMPILIAFYSAISRSPHIKSDNFMWLELGHPDPFYILPVLAAITTYVQMKIMSAQTPQVNPQLAMMNTIMPFFILFIAISLPSALSLYWVYGNIFSIIQTILLKDLRTAPNQEGALKK